MPPKIRKKSETGGLNQPDQVMTGLQATYGYLDKFKYHIVIGFVAIVLLLLGISGFVSYQESSRDEVSKEFFEAFKYVDAPVGEDATKVKDLPVFEDEAQKFTKLNQELDAFLAENDSSDVASVAKLAKASALIKLDEFQEASEILAGLADQEGLVVMAPMIHETLGYLSLKLDKAGEAETHFQAMRDSAKPAYLKARALMHLGDLYHPMTRSASVEKDKEKAKEFYEQAKELLPKEDEVGADDLAKAATEEIESRLSLLAL